MAARPRRTERAKPLRLACWNSDGVRGRKIELEYFLNQHVVDTCLLSETFLNHGQAFRLPNYVRHRTDRPTAGGGRAILIRRGTTHQSVPIPGLTHLEATAIQVTMAGKPVIIIPAYLSPSRPLIGADLFACFGGGMPVLMAGELNAKHVDWNLRLSTRRGKLLRDYADGNSCLIFGPDTQTTKPYNPLATSDVLDIVITKNLTSPVYLTSCSELSSDHLPILWHYVSLIQHPPDRPDFRRTDWANFQTQLENQIPFDPELHDGMAIDTGVENFSGAVLKALAVTTPKRRPRADTRHPIPAGIQDEIRLKNRLRRQWQVTRDTNLRAEVNRLQRSVTRRLNEWRNDQWSATLESLDSEDQSLWGMAKRVMRVRTPSPPGHPRGNRSVRLWESRRLCWHSGDSVSAGGRPLGPGSYWDDWRGAKVVLSDACQRTQVNQPSRGSQSHQRVSRSARLLAPTAYLTEPRSIFPIERYPSWSGSSMQFSSPTTSLPSWSTLEWPPSLNRGRIRHYHHPIDPLVCWARLVSFWKRSY